MLNICKKCDNKDLGLFLLRLSLGIVFLHAGYLKITNIDMVLSGFSSMGFPMYLAYFVAYAEFISGASFVLGLFARHFAVITSIIMFVAIYKVHFVNGFGLSVNGYEYTLVLLLLSVSLINLGTGKYALNNK